MLRAPSVAGPSPTPSGSAPAMGGAYATIPSDGEESDFSVAHRAVQRRESTGQVPPRDLAPTRRPDARRQPFLVRPGPNRLDEIDVRLRVARHHAGRRRQ